MSLGWTAGLFVALLTASTPLQLPSDSRPGSLAVRSSLPLFPHARSIFFDEIFPSSSVLVIPVDTGGPSVQGSDVRPSSPHIPLGRPLSDAVVAGLIQPTLVLPLLPSCYPRVNAGPRSTAAPGASPSKTVSLPFPSTLWAWSSYYHRPLRAPR